MKRKRNPSATAKAAALFRKFTGHGADRVVEFELPQSVKGLKLPPLTFLGQAKKIEYVTKTKQGVLDVAGKAPDGDANYQYVHGFSKETYLLAVPGAPVLIIVGKRLKVKDVGITG